MRQLDLSLGVLQQIRHAALQHAEPSAGETRGVFAALDAAAAGLDANQPDAGFIDKLEEEPDGIAAAAHAGNQFVGEPAFARQDLLLRFLADDAMEKSRTILGYGCEP